MEVALRARLLMCGLVAGACLAAFGPGTGQASDAQVRPAAVAGTFYPAARRALSARLREMLYEAEPSVPGALRDQTPRALIVPHSDYERSGRTAAMAYKLLEGTARPSRVILLGPAHHASLVGRASVADFDSYETPLGAVPVDREARDRLVENGPFDRTRQAHVEEHALEVQLPFLQALWPAPPPVVPVLLGQMTEADSRRAAAAIAGIMEPDALLVVSSDFTHYGREFGYAPFDGVPPDELPRRIRELDMRGVRYIEERDPPAFREYLAAYRPTICGALAISIMLEVFGRVESSRPVFLAWANSGAMTGSYDGAVSYVAMAVYAPEAGFDAAQQALAEEAARPQRPRPAPRLTAEEQRALLDLVRQSTRSRVTGRDSDQQPELMTETLRDHHGVVLTLRMNGGLRAQMAQMMPNAPLWATVRDLAALAASGETGFPPVERHELDSLTVELAVLGSLLVVNDPAEIEIGRDGLIVSRAGRRGVVLPRVAIERGWDEHEFLRRACRRAGLPPDAWEQPGTDVLRFTATVFSEESRR